jgi:hypothetical protein
VRLFSFQSRRLHRKFLPHCRSCRRYVLLPAHKVVLALLALLALAWLTHYAGLW